MTETQALIPIETSPDNADFLRFIDLRLQPKHGSRLLWTVAYEHFSDWWSGEGGGVGEALTAQQFGEAMQDFCRRAKISVRNSRGRIYCANVRLVG